MTHFPRLEVIEDLKKQQQLKLDDSYYIISVQHLLQTTGSLFEALIEIGFIPKNIFLTGKIYSTHEPTRIQLKNLGINIIESTYPQKLGTYSECLEIDIKKMWRNLLSVLKPKSKIIILDDGGYTLKNIPEHIIELHNLIGIEQTTSGIRMQSAFDKIPVISVASSAAKTFIEPPIVSEAVRIKLGKIISELNPKTIGIVGFGHIGKAVAFNFMNEYKVNVFDINEKLKKTNSKQISISSTLDRLFLNSDIIIGATGQDISNLKWFELANGNKTLISVSSGDIEFNQIIQFGNQYLTEQIYSPLQDLNFVTKNGYKLQILRGGMVANFTGSADSSPANIIQITRGLLMGSVIQAVEKIQSTCIQSGAVVLNPIIQNKVVKSWFLINPDRKNDYDEELLENFANIEWIRNNSGINT